MTPTRIDFLGSYNDAVDACPYVIDSCLLPASGSVKTPYVYDVGTGEVNPSSDKLEGTRPGLWIHIQTMLYQMI